MGHIIFLFGAIACFVSGGYIFYQVYKHRKEYAQQKAQAKRGDPFWFLEDMEK